MKVVHRITTPQRHRVTCRSEPPRFWGQDRTGRVLTCIKEPTDRSGTARANERRLRGEGWRHHDSGAATVGSDDSIADAARIMLEHWVSGLPVVDGEGALVGIVTERGSAAPRRDLDRAQASPLARHVGRNRRTGRG